MLDELLKKFENDFRNFTKRMPIRGNGNHNKIKTRVKEYIVKTVKEFEQVDILLKEIEVKYQGYKFQRVMANDDDNSYVSASFNVNGDYTMYISLCLVHSEESTLYIEIDCDDMSDDYYNYICDSR